MNNSPDLYLQPGVIGRVYEQVPESNEWKDLEYTTIDNFINNYDENKIYLCISLKYGDIGKFKDTLNIPRVPGNPDESAHIPGHPIKRVKDKEIIIQKLKENLENRYDDDQKYTAMVESILNRSLMAQSI